MSSAPSVARLLTDRADITGTRWHETEPEQLGPGQVRCRIDHVGFSANNATYAALGDAMGYWRFFPSEDPGWGCVPVWGYATVVESRCDDLPEGEPIFGFLPFGTEVVLSPTDVRAGGFVDGAEHRSDLHPVYNSYTRVEHDPTHPRHLDAYNALLRPLFTTSYLIAGWLVDERFFGAEAVILSSASSKTAFGTAHALAHLGAPDGVEVIGLTSPPHVSWTAGLGLYDRVLGYDEIARLDPARPSVYVDFSGSAEIRAEVHSQCADLRHSSAVGLTHWRDPAGPTAPGPAPEMFFAPTEAQKQFARWGQGEFFRRTAAAMAEFIALVGDAERPLLRVTWHEGRDAAEEVYRSVVAGELGPDEAPMLSL